MDEPFSYVERLGVVVGETASFQAEAKRLLSEDELAGLIGRLAHNPEEGVVIPGTGGVRKTRIGLGNKGKRAGARVIYFYHDDQMPLYLLAIYAKSENIDLSAQEKAEMKELVKAIVRSYGRRRRSSDQGGSGSVVA